MLVGGETVKVYLFVATLGYSRLPYVRGFRHEPQSVWFNGLQGGSAHFHGAPREVLLGNARALVEHHDVQMSFGAEVPLSAPHSDTGKRPELP